MPAKFAAEQIIFDPGIAAGVRLGVLQADDSVTDRILGGDERLLARIVGASQFTPVPQLDDKNLLAIVAAIADPRHTEYGEPFGEEQFVNIRSALSSADLAALMADLPEPVQQFAKSVIYEEYLPVLGSPWKGVAALASLVAVATPAFVTLGPIGMITLIAIVAGGIVLIRVANGLGEGLENYLKRLGR